MKALGPLIVVPRVVTVADSLLQPRPARSCSLAPSPPNLSVPECGRPCHHAALLARRIPPPRSGICPVLKNISGLSMSRSNWSEVKTARTRGMAAGIAVLIGCLVLLVFLFAGLAGPVVAAETSAREAILLDFETGAVLFEKDADAPTPPASMSKLMTAYMVFEQLAEGSLQLSDTFAVSERAWRMGGSKMFVEINSRVSVEDLLRGIIVQSGNDACIVIAEGLASSEKAFADDMTRRGREIGLTDSVFRNASGWPDPDHHMTARDLATLTMRLIRDFPDYYGYFREKTFTFNEIRQGNRNPLLYKDVGADGLKTGHTKASGYGITASAERRGRRLILVINGMDSVNARARESERLLDWGFRKFQNTTLFEAGETVAEAEVWLGETATVPLIVEEQLRMTLARRARGEVEAKMVYEGPVAAPVQKGAPIGTLEIASLTGPPHRVQLVAGADVDRLGPLRRLGAAVIYLLWGVASQTLEASAEHGS